MRCAGGTVEGWRPPAIGRQGTVEAATLRGERATAPLEDIWVEKIHGCSCRGGNTSAAAQRDVQQLKSTTWATSVDFIGLEIAASRRKEWRTDTHSGRAFRQITDRMFAFGGPTVFHIDQY